MSSHDTPGSARALLSPLTRIAAAVVLALVVAAGVASRDTGTTHAAFHIAHIEEVMFGYGGDSTQQYVEIKMTSSGQNIVRGTRLSAWNADGSFFGILLEVPVSPTIPGPTNGRWLMATAAYAANSGVAPDFTFTAAALPATGMICWGAPGVVPELPPTWAADNPLNYVDCVPYGGYTGAPPGTIVNAPATALGLGDGMFQSLQRLTDTNNTNADFMYACPTPQSILNNAQGYHHDTNFTELGPTKVFDDLTLPNSDTVGNDCGDTDDDNDSLSDADEASGAACGGQVTDPLKRDSDGDNFLDGAECSLGTNPNLLGSKPLVSACGPSTDADGDGINAQREFCFYNTNPAALNTDGDGCNDGREIASINGDTQVNVLDLQQLAAESGPYTLPGSAVKVNYDITKNSTIDVLDLQQVAARSGVCP
jgi:hypothetical protein